MEAKVLTEGRAVFSLDLHPAYSSNPLEGIRLLLEPRLLRWDNELDGVLLAYRNLQRLPAQAEIRPYFPYIQLKVVADVLIFRPTVGSTLCGRVTEMGGDFVGYTVLGALNGAIGRQSIRPQLSFNTQTGSWRCEGRPEGDVDVGSDILFSVEGVRVSKDGVTAIRGSLKEPWSGACKAAAHAWPTAFGNLHRWQDQPAGASIPGLFPAPLADAAGVGVPATLGLLPRSDSLQAIRPPAQATPATKPGPVKPRKLGLQPEGEAPVKKQKQVEPQLPHQAPPTATASGAASGRKEAGLGSEAEAPQKKKKQKAGLPADGVETAVKARPSAAGIVEVKVEEPKQRSHKKRRREGEPKIPAPVSGEPPADPAPSHTSSQNRKKLKVAAPQESETPTPVPAGSAPPSSGPPLANGIGGGTKSGLSQDVGLEGKKPKQRREGKAAKAKRVSKHSGDGSAGEVVAESVPVKLEAKGLSLLNGFVSGREAEVGISGKKKKSKVKREVFNSANS